MSNPPVALPPGIPHPTITRQAKQMCLEEHIDPDVLLRIFITDLTKSGMKMTSKVVKNVKDAKKKVSLKDRMWLLDMLNDDEYLFVKFFYRHQDRKRIGRVTMEKFISKNLTRRR